MRVVPVPYRLWTGSAFKENHWWFMLKKERLGTWLMVWLQSRWETWGCLPLGSVPETWASGPLSPAAWESACVCPNYRKCRDQSPSATCHSVDVHQFIKSISLIHESGFTLLVQQASSRYMVKFELIVFYRGLFAHSFVIPCPGDTGRVWLQEPLCGCKCPAWQDLGVPQNSEDIAETWRCTTLCCFHVKDVSCYQPGWQLCLRSMVWIAGTDLSVLV